MSGLLLFFAIGLAEFIAFAAWQGRPPRLLFLILPAAGLAAGALITVLPVRFPAFGFHLPAGLAVWIGGVSGLLLALVESKQGFRESLLPFFITPLLGLALAATAAAGVWLTAFLRGPRLTAAELFGPVLLVSGLVGFMTAFGYTLPRRWFQRYLE
ncbi:MAG: hypothetical protein QUS35_11700 [bacterium]|nr:hypothetical protein [bacterium]